jgi:hypothetical protein
MAGLGRSRCSGPLVTPGGKSRPRLVISNADTARPTISGFVRTALPQRCQFELVVNDGQFDSFPAFVDVVVLPVAAGSTLRLESPAFDPNKPTVVFFGGGNCITGGGGWNSAPWADKANIITWSYSPDNSTGLLRYERCGDILLGYRPRRPPTIASHPDDGHSRRPARHRRATYLNCPAMLRGEPRHVLDARCRNYAMDVAEYLASARTGSSADHSA